MNNQKMHYKTEKKNKQNIDFFHFCLLWAAELSSFLLIAVVAYAHTVLPTKTQIQDIV